MEKRREERRGEERRGEEKRREEEGGWRGLEERGSQKGVIQRGRSARELASLVRWGTKMRCQDDLGHGNPDRIVCRGKCGRFWVLGFTDLDEIEIGWIWDSGVWLAGLAG